MKSQFRDRGEFQESLNIYPRKIFSLKLEWFLGLLGALAILGHGLIGKMGVMVSRGTINGYENRFI